jgi:cytochrome c2
MYLRDPKPLRYASEGVRPRLRMPGFHLTEAEATDLAAFLAMQKDSNLVPLRSDIVARLDDSELIEEGRTLFEEYQCLGCHQLGTQGNEVGPPLDSVGTRRTPEYVAALLENPDGVVPGTAMKDHELWDEEIIPLTVYLMSRLKP